MANDEHVAILKQGVTAWNAWRDENPDVRPDLREADLREADLREANLSRADLAEAHLSGADLSGANLIWAHLSGADLSGAKLTGTFGEAYLRRANLSGADLSGADLSGANLSRAFLAEAKLDGADLRRASLSEASLNAAILIGADLREAKLSGADLTRASLIDTNFSVADLTGCRIYGISAWRLKLEGTKQQNLVITRADEPTVTVDNIEVAQFVYLLLNNQKLRSVIDTITSKAVLILGRFTDERKAVLDALREELRKRDYLPILFDFNVPATRDITETVSLLARMARFIIADLTDPSSIPKELEAIVPGLAVPVQPLLEGASRPYAMFKDYWKYDWVLPVYRYEGLEPLLATLAEKVIAPAEGKVKALEERRRMIEAELTKPQ
jgi:Pentapeptide repeats (8 copies)